MKKFLKFFSVLILGLSIGMVSCGKDNEPEKGDPDDGPTVIDPNKPVADPENTVTVNLLVGETNSGATWLGEGISVYVDAAYNLCCYYGQLIEIGKVAGLGNIVKIPENGWKDKAAVIVGNGYVLKSGNTRFARLFVESEMISTTGGVMGYTVKYQCPMETEISVSPKTVTFEAEGGEEEVSLLSGTNVEVKSKPDWVRVDINYPKLLLTAEENLASTQRTGVIVLSNSTGEKEISVIQNGGEDIFGGGSGTEEDPYIISSAKHLDNVRLAPENLYFKQTVDIDLSKYIDADGNGWEPINNFKGTYDGNFKKIKGLWINRPTTDNIGLFGSANGATFKGVMIELADQGIIGSQYVAGICGKADERTYAINCSVEGKSNIEGNIFGENMVGGIINGCKVEQSRMIGNVTAYQTYYGVACGIGYFAIPIDCYVVGDVKGYYDDSSYAFVNDYYDRPQNCYIVGNYGKLTGTHCYGSGNLSEDAMKKKSTYEGWNFTKIWSIKEGIDYPKLRCFE